MKELFLLLITISCNGSYIYVWYWRTLDHKLFRMAVYTVETLTPIYSHENVQWASDKFARNYCHHTAERATESFLHYSYRASSFTWARPLRNRRDLFPDAFLQKKKPIRNRWATLWEILWSTLYFISQL